MKRRLAVVVASAVLVASCGDDDGSSGDSLSDAQQAAADAGVAQGEELGFTLERGCVEDLAAQLSEEDAQLLADSGGDADLSPEGEELGAQLLGCADEGELVDFFLDSVLSFGNIDEDCARRVLEGADLVASLNDSAAQDEIDAELQDCIQS